MMDVFINYSEYFLLGLMFLVLILVIASVTFLLQMKKMKRRLDRFLGSGSDKHDMERMLGDFLERTEAVDEKYSRVNHRIDSIDRQLGFCIQKTGMVRYNPFQDTGGDLSFALALLNEHNDGIVISSLYGRESSYVYGKTISEGRPSHSLSPEEEKALRIAVEE